MPHAISNRSRAQRLAHIFSAALLFAALCACSTPQSDDGSPRALTSAEIRHTLLSNEIERAESHGETSSPRIDAFDHDGSWASLHARSRDAGVYTVRNGVVCVNSARTVRRECWRLLRAGEAYFTQAPGGANLRSARLIPIVSSRGGAVLHRLSSEEIAEALNDKCFQRLEYSGGIDLALSFTEYFSSDGVWGRRADRVGSVQGRFSVSSGLVCVEFASGVGNCRRMLRDDSGQLYAQYWPSGGLPPIRVRTFTSPHCNVEERN